MRDTQSKVLGITYYKSGAIAKGPKWELTLRLLKIYVIKEILYSAKGNVYQNNDQNIRSASGALQNCLSALLTNSLLHKKR